MVFIKNIIIFTLEIIKGKINYRNIWFIGWIWFRWNLSYYTKYLRTWLWYFIYIEFVSDNIHYSLNYSIN